MWNKFLGFFFIIQGNVLASSKVLDGEKMHTDFPSDVNCLWQNLRNVDHLG